MQPNHEELDERPLCGLGEGRNKYEKKKKKRQRIVWNFFFKTVCNTNPAKTIVQKVTKQQSLGLMQYRLYRNSHDEMCRSGTVNTKEPRRRLIFQPTVCVLDFFFPPKFPYNKQTSRSAQQAMVEVCSPEETMEKQVSRGHEDPQRLSGNSTWCAARSVQEDVDLVRLLRLLEPRYHIPSYKVFTECFLTSTNEGACPC